MAGSHEGEYHHYSAERQLEVPVAGSQPGYSESCYQPEGRIQAGEDVAEGGEAHGMLRKGGMRLLGLLYLMEYRDNGNLIFHRKFFRPGARFPEALVAVSGVGRGGATSLRSS